MSKKDKFVNVWAWEIKDQDGKWVLCYWAAPSKEMLLEDSPGGDARPVRVEMRKITKKRKVRKKS